MTRAEKLGWGKGRTSQKAQLSGPRRDLPNRTRFLSSASFSSFSDRFFFFSSPHCLLFGLIKVQRLHLPLLSILSQSGNQTAQQPRAEPSQHNHRPRRRGLPSSASLRRRRRPPGPGSLGHPPSRRWAAAGLGDLNDWGWDRSTPSSPRPSGCTSKFRGWVPPDAGNPHPQTHS